MNSNLTLMPGSGSSFPHTGLVDYALYGYTMEARARAAVSNMTLVSATSMLPGIGPDIFTINGPDGSSITDAIANPSPWMYRKQWSGRNLEATDVD